MKKLRFTAFALIIALSALLISGCSKPKYEKLTFDWVDKDIKEITLDRELNCYTITDEKDIKKLVEYITDANIVSKKEDDMKIGCTTYAIKVTLENGEFYWVELSNSLARWNKDRETQIICTVETDYFKPLIEKMDSIC